MNIVSGNCGVPIGSGQCQFDCSTNSTYDLSLENHIKLSPNPTDGNSMLEIFDINFDKLNLTMYNQSGNVIWRKNIKNGEKEIFITIPPNQGIYFLEIIVDKNYLMKKLIKI
jgi:hypothetical protein